MGRDKGSNPSFPADGFTGGIRSADGEGLGKVLPGR
jgi:hypothetical protein